jgi:formylglycine-generating enzyme required for sulfatase activity
MNPDAELQEDRFTDLLAACDEALAAGAGAPTRTADLPAELHERLDKGLAGVKLLREVLTPAAGTPLRQLGRFLVRREVGRGAFGVVFLAHDPQLRREVALKVPRVEVLVDNELRQRFVREARVAAGLDHPNLVAVYEAGQEGPLCYIASAFCPGPTLAQWLKQHEGQVPLRTAARLVETLAEAVQHAHVRGVVHRDLKPSNILLAPPAAQLPGGAADVPGGLGFIPRITDFGLAKVLVEDFGSTAGSPTRSGAVLGTPGYMAPEQAAGKSRAVGTAADVYALGVVLYELLVRRPPFQAETPLETLLQVGTEEPLPPSRLRPKLPRDLETICLKCLHKDPGRRYASAQALADDLRRFLAGEPIRARPAGVVERLARWARRRPTAAALLGAGVLAGVLAVLGAWQYTVRVRETEAVTRTRDLVDDLTRNDVTKVPLLARELRAAGPRAEPLLRQAAAAAAPGSPAELHVRLALLDFDPDQVPFLAGRLLHGTPDEVAVLREALWPYRERFTPELWRLLEDGSADREQRLRAACALALFDPANPRWQAPGSSAPSPGQVVVERLVQDNPIQAAPWVEVLRPARLQLLPPLRAVYRDEARTDERHVAATILAEYAADRPEVLVDLLVTADAKHFALFWPPLRAQREAALPLLQRVLDETLTFDWQDAPLNPAWGSPEEGLRGQLEQAGGMLAERFAFCQTLPLDQLTAVVEGLRPCGYRPLRVRPYPPGGQPRPGDHWRVAVLWQRDGRDFRWLQGVSAEEVTRRDREEQQRGYLPLEAAGYLAAGGQEAPAERYVAVWVRAEKEGEEARLTVGLRAAQKEEAGGPLFKLGFAPNTAQVFLDGGGEPRFSSVWGEAGGSAFSVAHEVCGDEAAFAGQDTIDRVPVDVALFPPDAKGRNHAGVWWDSPVFEGLQIHGLDPAAHLARCRALAEQGFRPVALAVAPRGPGQPLLTASAWHRPAIPDRARDALAGRQANAAVALYLYGDTDRVWPLFRHSPEPTRRTYLIHRLAPLGADPLPLVRRLDQESDVSARRALILCLGEFQGARLPPEVRQRLVPRLLDAYRTDPDPGIHSAIDWLLRWGKEGPTPRNLDWGQADALRQIDAELRGKAPSGGRRWYVNGQGQTLCLFPGPVEFLMGAPGPEPARGESDTRRGVRISRNFAVGTREVTNRQFRAFLQAHPEVGYGSRKGPTPDPDGPAGSVSMYRALQYCRWLSEVEQLPPEEQCYPPVAEIERRIWAHQPVPLPADYLRRTGYRLPTRAEWEYACRAQTVSSRPFGVSEELLRHFAWYDAQSRGRAWPAGQKKPNDFGLFDMLGNVWEWCQGPWHKYPGTVAGAFVEDDTGLAAEVPFASAQAITGGGFDTRQSAVRSAVNDGNVPWLAVPQVGFRVARTWR